MGNLARMTMPAKSGRDGASASTLDKISAGLGESLERFKAASAMYSENGSKDGALISKQFLEKFLEPKPRRSATAIVCAREGIELLRQFHAIEASFTTDIAIIGLKMNQTVAAIGLAFIEKQAEVLGMPIPPSPDPTAALLKWNGERKQAVAALQTSKVNAEQRAAAVGGFVIKICTLATDLLEQRQVTSRTFAVTHVQSALSWKQVVQRFKAQGADEMWDVALEEAWRALVEKASEMAEVAVGKESPLWSLPKVFKAAAKVFKKREVDTSPGGTDLMLRLVEKLRRENALFDGIRGAYETALAEFDRLSRLPL